MRRCQDQVCLQCFLFLSAQVGFILGQGQLLWLFTSSLKYIKPPYVSLCNVYDTESCVFVFFWFSIPDCWYSVAGIRWCRSIYHSHSHYSPLQVKIASRLSVTPSLWDDLYPSLFKLAICEIVKWASVSQSLSKLKEKTEQGWVCRCPSLCHSWRRKTDQLTGITVDLQPVKM